MDFLKDILGFNIELYEVGIIVLIIILTGFTKLALEFKEKFRLLYSLIPFAYALVIAVLVTIFNIGDLPTKITVITKTTFRFGGIAVILYDVIFDKIRKLFADKEIKDDTKNN